MNHAAQHIRIADLLTDDQLDQAIRLKDAAKIRAKVLFPDRDRILAKLGGCLDLSTLAFMIEELVATAFVMAKARESRQAAMGLPSMVCGARSREAAVPA